MPRSPLPIRRRRPSSADGSRSSRPILSVVAAPPEELIPADVRLEAGNLVDVADALGAQVFSVVDAEVTFTARSAKGERQWRGHLGSAGLTPLLD